MEQNNIFNELFHLNVTDKVETKKTGKTSLSYLSWSWAWAEFKKRVPDAKYEIKKFDDGNGKLVPYLYDEALGIMTFTEVTAGGITHEMWLPVMDGQNKAMKFKPYSFKTKYGEKHVEAASMFDVNKTLMRCLVKNLAMFGLGLHIYAGEDLPEMSEEQVELEAKKAELRKVKMLIDRAAGIGFPDAQNALSGKSYDEITEIVKKWKEDNK